MVRSEQPYGGECEEGGLNTVHWEVRMTGATNDTPQEVPRISLTPKVGTVQNPTPEIRTVYCASGTEQPS